jgi:hypothetical protein
MRFVMLKHPFIVPVLTSQTRCGIAAACPLHARLVEQ